jgi:hypothetical protein
MRTPRPTAVTANNQDNRALPSQAPASSLLAADQQRSGLQGFVGALAWISRRYTPISIGPSHSEIRTRKSRPPQSQSECRTRVNVPKFQKFQPCRTHRRSVLVVTHDTRLLEFADRIIYIEDGALNREEAPASNVYRMRA